MKREFHAQFPLALQDSVTQGFAIAWLVKQSTRLPARWPEIAQIEDDWARLEILSQAIVTGRKEEARMGTRKMSGGLRYWMEHHSEHFFHRQLKDISTLKLAPALPDLSLFPPGTWAVQVTFTLRKPYISRDDVDFYILDNPVKKEWVFKVPYVAPSQWKGALRAAMIRELTIQLQENRINEADFVKRRLQLYRLFGNEKDGTAEFLNRTLASFRVGPLPQDANDEETQEEWQKRVKQEMETVAEEFVNLLKENGYRHGDIEGFQGRLHFYPTFFDRIGLEVINPHDRKTGAGRNPILFECVPAGARGVFTLLYVPLDLSDKPKTARQQAREDLRFVAQGIPAMLTTYGFGAKTSSGYGVADVEATNIVVMPKELRKVFIKEFSSNKEGYYET